MPSPLMVVTAILSVTLVGFAGVNEWTVLAAEQTQRAKKPRIKADTKQAPSKTAPTKFQTAEAAGKSPACFGAAPKIETVSPDEGKAGDKVTIAGTNFGTVECLRSVSFGPGHEAKFQMEDAAKITTIVPSGGRKGLTLLTVTTASGEDSQPFLVK